MAETSVKAEAQRLVECLPDEATWDDLKYLIYVRSEIDAGRESAKAEPVFTTAEILEEFGIEAGE